MLDLYKMSTQDFFFIKIRLDNCIFKEFLADEDLIMGLPFLFFSFGQIFDFLVLNSNNSFEYLGVTTYVLITMLVLQVSENIR